MSNDNDAAIQNAIKQLAQIENAVAVARHGPLATATAGSFDRQVSNVVQLLTATEVVRQLDKLVRAAS